MSESVLKIEYAYSASDEATLESSLSVLQKAVGGQRRPKVMAAGSIDLLTCLEIVVTFVGAATFGPALKNYLAGLFGTDGAKPLGERHRESFLRFLGKVRDDLAHLLASVNQQFREGLMSPKRDGKKMPIAVNIQIDGVECFIVLNGPQTFDDALDRLPAAISKMLEFIAETGLPDQSTVIQLCLDPVSRDWRYLLTPSHRAFGRFVDRVVDLSTGELLTLSSRQEFIELLRVREEEGFKYLVDPYRYSD